MNSDFIVYVDESGDHNLSFIDTKSPVFVLNFCIFHKDSYVNKIVPDIQKLKFKHFGHDMIILHEREISKQKPPFTFLMNKDKRKEFIDDLNKLVEDADFTIASSVIDKGKHLSRYTNPYNPYNISLKFCMERLYFFLKSESQHDHITYVIFEKRGDKEDNELELEFRRISGQKRFNFEIIFADKKANSAGLQIADLTARPIGRYVINPNQSNRAWEIIKQKLYANSNGDFKGYGLKIFP